MIKEKPPRKSMAERLKAWQVNQAESYKTYIKTSAVGLEFGLSIAVGALLGYFADKYFATSPYGLLIGVVIGSIAAVKRLWQFVKNYVDKNNKSNGPS